MKYWLERFQGGINAPELPIKESNRQSTQLISYVGKLIRKDWETLKILALEWYINVWDYAFCIL